MEIMEEGNLQDRVRILLQRDLTFYHEHQKVLLNKLCPSVIGGFLDFPCITTFVATKITAWWEESYYLLFHSFSSMFSGNITIDIKIMNEESDISLNKSMTPEEFVNLISQSSKMLLDHLNILSQEALDHADLPVLTGAIGAATLTRNTIRVYNQQLIKTNSSASLSKELKTYESMSEELAERLLDLHCRLISLYILQDADSLNWLAEHQFYEGERSSYTIQMWWFYVQGLRLDLWNSMSPKSASRIFSGVLNESLTILTSRYMQVRSSKARSELVTADLSNILLCVFKLLPSICKHADELLGCKTELNVVRDIHAKCHLLLRYFLIRAAPLTVLYKIFKNGFTQTSCLMRKENGFVEPWIIFVMQNEAVPIGLSSSCNLLPDNLVLKYELLVAISQEQPEWTLFLKVLRMNECWILHEILHHVIVDEEELGKGKMKKEYCKEFLCKDDCVSDDSIQASILHLLVIIGNRDDIENTIMKVLEKVPDRWAIYFNHSQIWNQNRPLWIQALLTQIRPSVQYVLKTVECSSTKKHSPIEMIRKYIETMKMMVNCLPEGIVIISSFIENCLPPDILPLEDSVLIQLMAMSLYDELGSESSISEALCRMEMNRTAVVTTNVKDVAANILPNLSYIWYSEVDEILLHHILMDKSSRKSLKVLHTYLRQDTSNWLLSKLGIETKPSPGESNLLKNMFYIGNREYDQFLSGAWIPKWSSLLNLPLGLTTHELQNLILLRPEFASETSLFKQDQLIIKHIKSFCT